MPAQPYGYIDRYGLCILFTTPLQHKTGDGAEGVHHFGHLVGRRQEGASLDPPTLNQKYAPKEPVWAELRARQWMVRMRTATGGCCGEQARVRKKCAAARSASARARVPGVSPGAECCCVCVSAAVRCVCNIAWKSRRVHLWRTAGRAVRARRSVRGMHTRTRAVLVQVRRVDRKGDPAV